MSLYSMTIVRQDGSTRHLDPFVQPDSLRGAEHVVRCHLLNDRKAAYGRIRVVEPIHMYMEEGMRPDELEPPKVVEVWP